MTVRIERNRNTDDEATVNPAVELNSSTSVKIADANEDRTFFHASNDGASESIWIKLQAATVDNDKKGIHLNKKGIAPSTWEMPPDNIYTGEISAIADANSPNVFVTEY